MKNGFLIAGVAVLVFSLAGYYGNFVQWSGAEQTTAKILNAQQQWARRGSGNLNLKIEYFADNSNYTDEVSVSPSSLKKGDTEIKVFYMKKKPGRAIPVVVLKGKQRKIVFLFSLGIFLVVFSAVQGLIRKKTAKKAA